MQTLLVVQIAHSDRNGKILPHQSFEMTFLPDIPRLYALKRQKFV